MHGALIFQASENRERFLWYRAGRPTGSRDDCGVSLKCRLLICADWFDPGFRAGGPIRSCVNLVELLGESAEIAMITSDRDLGENRPYTEIQSDRWIIWRELARVCYCRSSSQRMFQFVRSLKVWKPDAIYLNSMFSVPGTLWPLLWVRLSRNSVRIVLAPRGMLKPSALAQKGWKKRPLLKFVRWLGLVKKVWFHATSAEELEEIQAVFGSVNAELVSNVPCVPLLEVRPHERAPGLLRLCFVGRVHPIKNLLWLLNAMASLDCRCQLIVVGPVEDQAYYEQCRKAVSRLPECVSVEFVGAKKEVEVRELLLNAEAMILPTQGENFGHAIFESLAVGTPVIISDRTIWRDLYEQQAGWDLSLDPAEFRKAILDLSKMSVQDYQQLRQGALRLAQGFLGANNFRTDYLRLFAFA